MNDGLFAFMNTISDAYGEDTTFSIWETIFNEVDKIFKTSINTSKWAPYVEGFLDTLTYGGLSLGALAGLSKIPKIGGGLATALMILPEIYHLFTSN